MIYILCGNKFLLLFSHWVMSKSLRPHWLQHVRLPCLSLSPRICSDLCPLSQWCYLSISSSATSFSFCLQSFPASESFPMSWLFTASESVHPVNIQGWLPFPLTSLISLQSKGLLGVFSKTTVWKHQFFSIQPSLWSNFHTRNKLL